MPVVPTYERSEGINAGSTGPMASPDAFGAAIGRGLQQAGAGIQALGGDLMERQQKLDAFDAQTKAQAFNNANDMALVEAGKTVQPGGVGLTDTVMKGFEKSSSAFLKNLPESQRARMAPFIEAERGRLQTNAFKAETGLQEDYQRGHLDRFENDALKEIYATPEAREAALARYDAYAGSTTLSPAEIEERKQRFRVKAGDTYGQAIAETDARAAAERDVRGVPPAAAEPASQPSPADGAAAARGTAPAPAAPAGQRARIDYGGADQRISAPARQMLDGIAASGVVPVVKVKSGYRDPHRNTRAGGAKGSQHLHGNAVDIDISGMSDEQKAAFLQAAVANGAKGIGIYPSGNSLHIDTRAAPAVWGAVKGNAYKGHSVEEAPAWAQPVLKQLFAGQTVAAPAGGAAPAGAANGRRTYANDPRFKDASLQGVKQADAMYERAYSERMVELRAEQQAVLQPRIENAMAEVMQTGTASDMPTRDDVYAAYPPSKAAEVFQKMEDAAEVGGDIAAMRTMPPENTAALLDERAPVPGSPTYARDAEKFEVLQQAAAEQAKARAADPFAYTARAVPAVAEQWDAAETPEARAAAVTAMAAAQREIGIPENSLALVPKQTVTSALANWGNTEAPYQQRMQAVADLVFSASQPAEQAAIVEQLVKAGMPAEASIALRAAQRGDSAAAERLSRAILADPKDMPAKLPDGMKDADINVEIGDAMFGAGSIGDAMFGTAMGVSGNDADVRAHYDVARKAVRFALAANGGDTEAAVASVAKDMFGDVAVETDTDMTIAVPKAYDPAVVGDGLRAQLGRIDQMLSTFSAPPDEGDVAPADRAGARFGQYMTGETIRQIIDGSQWRNAGDGAYMLVDQTTGMPIADVFGNIFTITAEEAWNDGLGSRQARQRSRVVVEPPMMGGDTAPDAPPPPEANVPSFYTPRGDEMAP